MQNTKCLILWNNGMKLNNFIGQAKQSGLSSPLSNSFFSSMHEAASKVVLLNTLPRKLSIKIFYE
jgi:hypothetical protein